MGKWWKWWNDENEWGLKFQGGLAIPFCSYKALSQPPYIPLLPKLVLKVKQDQKKKTTKRKRPPLLNPLLPDNVILDVYINVPMAHFRWWFLERDPFCKELIFHWFWLGLNMQKHAKQFTALQHERPSKIESFDPFFAWPTCLLQNEGSCAHGFAWPKKNLQKDIW